jgi:hypothetical protein
VGSCPNLPDAVDSHDFSTVPVHARNGLAKPDRAVFPVVHTPYDFYERI